MMNFISDTSLLLALGLLSLSALFLGVFVGVGVMCISFTVCGSFDPTVSWEERNEGEWTVLTVSALESQVVYNPDARKSNKLVDV